MEEGRDRPSEAPTRCFTKSYPTGRNGGGPRSALGGPLSRRRLFAVGVAAMEEGRDRPSEALLLRLVLTILVAAMEEGRDRPSEGFDETEMTLTPYRAAMEEGRDRPSEDARFGPTFATLPSRNGGGPRSALGGAEQAETAQRMCPPQWRRAEIGPRRGPTSPTASTQSASRNGGGPRSALGGPDRPELRTLRQISRNGGGPRSALGGDRPKPVSSLVPDPQWRRAEIGPRRSHPA